MPEPAPTKTKLDFKTIDFGKADAMNEKDLLVDGFLDTEGYIDKILNKDKYFVIGQKGSGKSAIASKLKIISEQEGTIAVNIQMLDDFDYDGFGGVIPSKESPEIKYANTWEFLLGLKFIEMYSEAEYSLINKESDPKDLVKGLVKLGLLPNTLRMVIQKLKTKDLEFDAKIAKFTVSQSKLESRDIKKMIDSVTNHLYQILPKKKHLIVIDGLDGVLTKRTNQYEILSSLIRSANTINRKFRDKGIDSRIIVLCRKDVLSKLNDPNRSKYIQDSGIELNWFQSVNNVKETNLYKLINLRASISLKADVDVMEAFFPHLVNDKETFRYLLDHTRYTPRDMIQIMNSIQNVSGKNGATQGGIKDGLNAYSDGYFLIEIKDSLVGMLNNDEIEEAFKALRVLGKITFTTQEFAEQLREGFNAVSMLSAMYIAGAIANVETDDKGKRYRASVFRNTNSIFNERQMITVNSGLRKALMLH